MKIENKKEIENLLFVRDKCTGIDYECTNDECIECPFYEGYCHFEFYLLACFDDKNENDIDDFLENKKLAIKENMDNFIRRWFGWFE